MDNHNKFNSQTVEVLSYLYQMFPGEPDIDSSKSAEPSHLTQTIEFWQRSGLIKVGQTAETFNGAAHFFFVGLTLPGLAVLRSPISFDGTNTTTLGERLIELDPEKNSSLAMADINQAVDELLKRLTN